MRWNNLYEQFCLFRLYFCKLALNCVFGAMFHDCNCYFMTMTMRCDNEIKNCCNTFNIQQHEINTSLCSMVQPLFKAIIGRAPPFFTQPLLSTTAQRLLSSTFFTQRPSERKVSQPKSFLFFFLRFSPLFTATTTVNCLSNHVANATNAEMPKDKENHSSNNNNNKQVHHYKSNNKDTAHNVNRHNKNHRKNKDIHFLSVVLSIPHPKKLCKHGEDASLQLTRALGVFDGVGSWNDDGIDPGKYTKKLSSLIEAHLYDNEHASISDAVQHAVFSNKLQGSSTICAAEVHGRKLRGLNVGDSALVVMREGREVFATRDQQHEFNYPYQVGYKEHGDLAHAQEFSFDLIEGDVVLLASDGLWDNVYRKDIAHIVRQHVTHPGDVPSLIEFEKEAQRQCNGVLREKSIRKDLSSTYKEVGKIIKKIALHLGTVAYGASQKNNGKTPFAAKARQVGEKWSGGKADDITIVIGMAVSAKDEKYRGRIEAICPNCTTR